MKTLLLRAVAAVASIFSLGVHASEQLAAQHNCIACHGTEKRLMGPAFRDIAARYKSEPATVQRLADKVMKGGTGAWGTVPMPANAVSADDAGALVAWVLAGAPAHSPQVAKPVGVLLRVSASPATIERGRYLVENVMGCANCHASRTPDTLPIPGKELAGGRVYDTPLFVAQPGNLTPDATGVGRFSAEQLAAIITEGKRPGGAPLAPMMPSNFYRALLPEDVHAIAAYLAAVPPVRNETRTPQYKQGWVVDVNPDAQAGFDTKSVASDPLARGRYLATLAHCLDCHTPGGQGTTDYVKDGGRGGKRFGTARLLAPNITSHPAKGIGAWSEDDVRRALFEGAGRDGRKLQYPMPWPYLAGLSAEDRSALVAWLRTLPARD